MTRFALLLLPCLLLPACGGSAHDKMVGEWKLDAEYIKSMPEFKKAGDQAEMMLGMMGSMTLRVTKDKIEFEHPMGKDSKSYTVKSEDGDTITIEVDNDGKKEAGTVKFDGDRMILTKKGDPMPIAFVRK